MPAAQIDPEGFLKYPSMIFNLETQDQIYFQIKDYTNSQVEQVHQQPPRERLCISFGGSLMIYNIVSNDLVLRYEVNGDRLTERHVQTWNDPKGFRAEVYDD